MNKREASTAHAQAYMLVRWGTLYISWRLPRPPGRAVTGFSGHFWRHCKIVFSARLRTLKSLMQYLFQPLQLSYGIRSYVTHDEVVLVLSTPETERASYSLNPAKNTFTLPFAHQANTLNTSLHQLWRNRHNEPDFSACPL